MQRPWDRHTLREPKSRCEASMAGVGRPKDNVRAEQREESCGAPEGEDQEQDTVFRRRTVCFLHDGGTGLTL